MPPGWDNRRPARALRHWHQRPGCATAHPRLAFARAILPEPLAPVRRADDGLDRPPLPLLSPAADAPDPAVHRDGEYRRGIARWHRAAFAAERLGTQSGYDEINLNCGCPSDRVQRGAFGARLMQTPQRVADCVKAMRD